MEPWPYALTKVEISNAFLKKCTMFVLIPYCSALICILSKIHVHYQAKLKI